MSAGAIGEAAGDPSGGSSFLAAIRIERQLVDKERSAMSVATHVPKTWLFLAVAQHGASAFDAYSTRYAVGHGAVEENPLMRPFAHSGSIYVVSQATPVVLDYMALRMRHSDNRVARRMWWLPQSLSAGTYVFVGVRNLRIAANP